jgi:hypothetical protein
VLLENEQAQIGAGSENGMEYEAHVGAVDFHARCRNMALEIGCEMHVGHAEILSPTARAPRAAD